MTIAAVPAQGVFMPQLDALRTIAVFAVFIEHLLDPSVLPARLRLPWGTYGVHLFFVLSGFLITGILLRSRTQVGESRSEQLLAVRQFFIRRFLRIFPLYYFVVFVGLVMGLGPFVDNAVSLLTYTVNFKIAFQGWYPDLVAHLWSLAVEEQFYLMWPWLILFMPRKLLAPAIVLAILVGPVFRLMTLITDVHTLFAQVATFSCIDSLGIGALLAYASNGAPVPPSIRRVLTRFVLPTAIVLLLCLESRLGLFRHNPAAYVIGYNTACALIFCWLVAGASSGFGGIAGRFLMMPPMLYLGRIAYGLYVYHALLQSGVFRLGRAAGLDWTFGEPLYFLVASAVSIGVASASWHAFERPINGLKERFSLDRGIKYATP